MTDIKIDFVNSVTRIEMQETISYAERTIASRGITLAESEKEGIEALREELELHGDVGKATIRLEEAKARYAHGGILKGLPEGSDDIVSQRFYKVVFDVKKARGTLDEVFARSRPVGFDLQVKVVDMPTFSCGNKSRSYYLGITGDGEKVAVSMEGWQEFMSRLGSEGCRRYEPTVKLVDCSGERRFTSDTVFPEEVEHRKVHCMDMLFADPRQQRAYERAVKAGRLSQCFYDILAGGERLTRHIAGEIAELDIWIAELTAQRDSIGG